MTPTRFIMDTVIVILPFGIFLAIYLYRKNKDISISKVPGPPSTSWYGPALEFMQGQVGEVEFPWQEKYGSIIRLGTPVPGGDLLLISDPKALQFIHQTGFKEFGPNPLRHAVVHLMTGPGLAHAQGRTHERQHKVMQPGFGVTTLRALVPVFFNCVNKMTDKWVDTINSGGSVIDIAEWHSKLTLDGVGAAIFDYQFGALDGNDDALINACGHSEDVIVETLVSMVRGGVISMALSRYIPSSIFHWIFEYGPGEKLNRIRRERDICLQFAEEIVQEKKAALLDGKENKDIMSLIVKANLSGNPDERLTDEELLAQFRTLLFAGNSTTTHTMNWMLWELSRHPEYHERLKVEIQQKQRMLAGAEWKLSDLDAMPFLNAFIKETLRVHPATFMVTPTPMRDVVLPLADPITLTTGEVVHSLPIPKGQNILSSLSGYNRVKSVWGEDAHVFNPDRFLGDGIKMKTRFGMYSNLASFVGGPKGCIGWKFALIFLQVHLLETASKFEFSPTPESRNIRRHASLVMTPKINDQQEKGISLPLTISIRADD